ncbi:hypothetical protein TNCV_3913021 [Trichonephila clavipes]|nr:hypothetical protein TNCV_3913021 [Trichonephila clavipes]
MTTELAPPLQTTTPHQWEDVSALDIFNVHRCATRYVLRSLCMEWGSTKTFSSSRGSTKTLSSSRGSTKAPSSSRGEKVWDPRL